MDVNLVLFKKNGTQKTIALPSEVTVIGRRRDCDLYIPLKTVSRRHCELSQNSEGLKLRDLGSRNGTFLNGKRVEEEVPVNPGDYVQIGPLTFQVQIDGKPQRAVLPGKPSKEPPRKAEAAAAEAKAEEQDSLLELAADDDSLPEIDIDEDDSFLEELEKL